MIEASKSKAFDRLFLRYNEAFLLRKHFRYVGFQGELDPLPGRSILYIMNHSSWWDGLLVYQLFRTKSKSDHYVMMDEKQLRQFRFFRKLGAYSIDKSSPQNLIPSLRYTCRLLKERKSVWLFPQGDIKHLELRPLELKEGAAHVLKQCPQTVVVPITAYYSLFHHQKVEATLLAGSPIVTAWDQMDKRTITKQLAAVLEGQLDAHRARIIEGGAETFADFERLVRPGSSTSEVFTAFKRRISGWKSFFGR